MRLTLFMLLLVAGNLTLVSGLYFTRLTWRSDIEPFGRRSRLFQIALHPERFATPARLGLIRCLNLAGALLLTGALAVVVTDIVLSTAQR